MAELKSSRKSLYQRIHRALKSMDEGERAADTLRRRDQEFDWFEADPGRIDCLALLSEVCARIRTRGVVLSPGYGFTTDSLLFHLAGVHAVNPVEWDLPFARFTQSFQPGCTIPLEAGTGGIEAAREVLRGREGELIIETSEGNFEVTFLDGDEFDHVTVKFYTFGTLDRFRRTVKEGWRPLDADTLRRFGRGDTDGSVWFEGEEMRRRLVEFGPESMSDLALLNATYWPGRARLYPEILRRKRSGDYDREFRDTYGVPVWQEQTSDPNLAPKGHFIARTMMSVEAIAALRAHPSLK